jgi:hypothetical protein
MSYPISHPQGLQGGVGISAETAVASASATPTIKINFFNMLESPRGLELNPVKIGNHGKIKRSKAS